MLIKQHMSERTSVLWTTWRTDAIFNICINRYDQLISYQCHNGPIEAIIFSRCTSIYRSYSGKWVNVWVSDSFKLGACSLVSPVNQSCWLSLAELSWIQLNSTDLNWTNLNSAVKKRYRSVIRFGDWTMIHGRNRHSFGVRVQFHLEAGLALKLSLTHNFGFGQST